MLFHVFFSNLPCFSLAFGLEKNKNRDTSPFDLWNGIRSVSAEMIFVICLEANAGAQFEHVWSLKQLALLVPSLLNSIQFCTLLSLVYVFCSIFSFVVEARFLLISLCNEFLWVMQRSIFYFFISFQFSFSSQFLRRWARHPMPPVGSLGGCFGLWRTEMKEIRHERGIKKEG